MKGAFTAANGRLHDVVPDRLQPILFRLLTAQQRFRFRIGVYDGPVCNSHPRIFLPHGRERRPNVLCLVCFSLRRRRAASAFPQHEITIEDLSVTDPDERLRLYGQADHGRRYGPNFAKCLQEPGFPLVALTSHTVRKMAVSETAFLDRCRRPA